MMDGQVKVIIQNNRTLLIKNIIPCKELMERLSEQNVFPESKLQEIKVTVKNIFLNRIKYQF